MKINRIIFSLLPIAAALASCTEFNDAADRFEPLSPDEFTPKSNVLMIEFTGQQCVNCPTAHEQIETYEQMFGERFISVSIHGGTAQMGIDKGPMALGTEDGVEYNELFKIESWPSAVVNWNSGNLKANYGLWISNLIKGMNRTTDLSIDATATAKDGVISVNVKLQSDEEQSPDSRLQIWLSEDSIVKMQLMPNGQANMNYIHNNVFRTTLCGISGEEVTIPADVAQESVHTATIDSAWKPENMHAVVFVYTESKGVTTVVKTPVKTTE